MALNNDMRKLAQNLLDDYDARLTAVADLRSSVRQELTDFQAAHQAITAEQQEQLAGFLDNLRHEVVEAGQATARFLKEIDQSHQGMTAEQRRQLDAHMADLRSRVAQASQATAEFLKEINLEHQTLTAEQRARLKEHLDSLHHQVGDLRQAATAFLKDIDSTNQATAAELRQKLSEQRSQLASDTTGFRTDVNAAFRAMASDQDDLLNEHIQGLRQEVVSLRNATTTFMKDLEAGRQSMAADQKKQLSADRSRLSHEVTLTRQGFQAQQQAAQTDLRESHQVWADFRQLKERKGSSNSPTRHSKQPEAVHTQASSPQEPAPAGDLTAIHGIGPGMVKLLNQAGISSVQQLAGSQPETVRQALGKAGRFAKVEILDCTGQRIDQLNNSNVQVI